VIQASHVSTGTTNNALALNPSGGNVGVGTTAPSVPFVVSGSSTGYTTGMMNVINNNTAPQACANILAPNISSTNGMLMNIGKSLTPYNAMGLAYYHQGDGSGSNFLNLAPYGNQNGLNVFANGNVGIGTTAPGAKLEVTGNVQITTNSSQPLTFLNSSGPYNWNVGGQNDGTFRIFAGAFNGVQVGWAGTSWSAISDRRLKEDIEPLDNCLSKIVSLNPVSYRMINRPSTLTKKQFGLIAQEVVDVIPDIVESSWNDAAQEDRYSLLYMDIIPFLIGAIKEQNITIAAQAATNSAMQSQLASLIAWAQTMGYPASS
jgi:hypothetical protein